VVSAARLVIRRSDRLALKVFSDLNRKLNIGSG
jgi:hypothetical protein